MHDNDKQRISSSYVPAELDTDFLLGESMRGMRLHLEFAKTEERLRSWGIQSTVVVFGSSRIVASDSVVSPRAPARDPRRQQNVQAER